MKELTCFADAEREHDKIINLFIRFENTGFANEKMRAQLIAKSETLLERTRRLLPRLIEDGATRYDYECAESLVLTLEEAIVEIPALW